MMFYGAPGATCSGAADKKPVGGAVANGTPFSIPGKPSFSYAPGKATIGVSLQAKTLL
jgi:hypothetical protein